jgi:AraC-like DNA-binding protein/TolB-like protein
MTRQKSFAPASTTEPSVLPRHVKHALTYLRVHLSEKVTLADLARACAISERTLLQQFKQFLGISPIAHLLRIRLAAARAQMQQSARDISVSDAASRCGFTHLGRFAAEYRKAFGERPSDTLQWAQKKSNADATGSSNSYLSRNDIMSLPIPYIARQRPLLMILPLRTETSFARQVSQELMEQVATALSRSSVACVTLADPLVVAARKPTRSPQERTAQGYCLHGRLVQRDDRIRITLWLTDTEGRHVWGDSYDSGSDGVVDLLRRVANSAVCSVIPGIVGAEIERVGDKDPRSLVAREILLRAFPLLLKIDRGSSCKVLAVTSRAMEMDPDDALPAAFAAYCHFRFYVDGTAASPAATRAEALRLSQRAGALDVGDPLVTACRAAVATFLQPYSEAEALVERALAMDPTSAVAWERKGYLLRQREPDQAIACFGRAMALHGAFMPTENCVFGIAQAHEAAGRLEEAAFGVRRAYALNPQAAIMHRFLIAFEEQIGNRSVARQLTDELCRAHPAVTVSQLEQTFPGECFDLLRNAGLPT